MPLARLLTLLVALLAPHAFAGSTPAPAFDVEDLEGKRYTRAGLAGKVVVLRFWFKDCGACRSERGALDRVVTRYQGNEDVVFLALALDKAPVLKAYLRKSPMRYAVVPDAEKLADAFGVVGYPTHVIIDREGNIVRRWMGAVDTFYRLTETIDALTRAPETPEPGPLLSALLPTSSPPWEPALLVRPERPMRGSTVRIYYAPSSTQHPAEAQLAWHVHSDTAFTQGLVPMRARGVLLSYELKVPWDARLVHLRVHARGDKRLVEHTLPIFGTDGQPVRDAFLNLGACDVPHPAGHELEPLKTRDGNELERLAATTDALLRTGDFKAVPPVLYAMMAVDRRAFLTRRALSRLLTQPPGEAWRQWPPGLLPWAWGVLAERDDVWSRQAAARSPAAAMDARAAERICAAWRTAEPDNPFAHDCLARILEREGRLQEALGASRAALDAVSRGTLPLYRTGGWDLVAREEERLWAHHAELSLAARDAQELVADSTEP